VRGSATIWSAFAAQELFPEGLYLESLGIYVRRVRDKEAPLRRNGGSVEDAPLHQDPARAPALVGDNQAGNCLDVASCGPLGSLALAGGAVDGLADRLKC
jgi:hypothetical protein